MNLHYKKIKILLLVILLNLAGSGCVGYSLDDSEPLARYGGVVLNKTGLDQFPASSNISNDLLAQRWLRREILSSEFAENPVINGNRLLYQTAEFRRRLMGQLFLDTRAASYIHVSTTDIQNEYDDHAELYQLTERAAYVTQLAFFFLEDAQAVLDTLSSAVSAFQLDSMLTALNFDQQLAYESRLPDVLADAIFTRPIGHWRGPVATEYGYHLLFVRERFLSGQKLPLEYVADKIYNRLFQTRLSFSRELVLDSLFEVFDAEIF